MKISFIVCTYSVEFFSDTIACIDSLVNQDYTDKEILIVMDKNDDLYSMFLSSIPKWVNIIINTQPGLSEARNLGIKNANGDIIIFIDDDAVVDKYYTLNILKNYDDEKVIGVFGKILPKGKPNYPEELCWIGGFTNKGFSEERCEVRNGYGCNMSFRRIVFDKVGLFNNNFGRTGKKLSTCEETEFSIRALNYLSDSKIIYDPSVIVYHKVHEYRQTVKYMIKRSYGEGIAKARINKLCGNNDKALSTEDKYLKYLLINAIPAYMKHIISGRNIMTNGKNIILIFVVIFSVGVGYSVERIK
jgi:GT2 family glycosyltransferase